MIGKRSSEHLYSRDFLNKIQMIKRTHRSGMTNKALASLRKLEKEDLEPVEFAILNNLYGIIYFSRLSYKKSSEFFKKSLKTSGDDYSLTEQVRFNLARTYYKINQLSSSYSLMKKIRSKLLNKQEKITYFKLFLVLAKKVGEDEDFLIALVQSLRRHETIMEIKEDRYFDILLHQFDKLNKSQKVGLIEDYSEGENLATGYLAFIEARNLIFKGERKQGFRMLRWIKEEFLNQNELLLLVSNFKSRIKNFSQIDTNAIGIILPFSGKRKNFAERAMGGIDFSIRQEKDKYEGAKIYTADSEGNPVVGKRKVKELIEKYSVSLIIGGLFSDEAKEEYLEARKYGVMFISLSQVFIDRKEKGFLLLETLGSVESQVEQVLSSKFLKNFGKKIALIYPKSDQGTSYINEIWMQSIGREIDIEIVDVQSYSKGTKDFRSVVESVLGLKYPRFREKELELMKEVYSLERSNIRRVQILPPIINFDWVYLPVYPQEAIQIIPAFSYYDATDVSFVGGPSWRSKIFGRVKEKRIHFIGDSIDKIDKKILSDFVVEYGISPRVIEINAFEAIHLVSQIFHSEDETERYSYNENVRKMGVLNGLVHQFRLSNDVWIKDMNIFKIHAGQVNKVEL